MLAVNKCELSGRFRMVARKAATGEVSKDTGWFENIITNYGMDCIGFGYQAFAGCTVGTGTTPENVNDTQIEVFKARTSSGAPGAPYGPVVGSTVPTYFAKYVVTYRFAEGEAAGNLTEVGIIAREFSAPYNLWSRTLIKDAGGSPVTMTVLPDEILDVSYECHIYPQQTITDGVVNLMGANYDFKVACSELADVKWARVLEGGLQPVGSLGVVSQYSGNDINPAPAHNPSGSYVDFAGYLIGLENAYAAGDYRLNISFKLDPGVFTGDIASLVVQPNSGSNVKYAVALNPSFNKLATVELKVVLSVSWARRA